MIQRSIRIILIFGMMICQVKGLTGQHVFLSEPSFLLETNELYKFINDPLCRENCTTEFICQFNHLWGGSYPFIGVDGKMYVWGATGELFLLDTLNCMMEPVFELDSFDGFLLAPVNPEPGIIYVERGITGD